MKKKLRCKNCLVTNTCENTVIDENSICNHCNDLKKGNKPTTKHLLSKDEKQKYVNDLDNILKMQKVKRIMIVSLVLVVVKIVYIWSTN